MPILSGKGVGGGIILTAAPALISSATPLALRNLRLWLDASEESSFTRFGPGAAEITEWIDKSANAYRFTIGPPIPYSPSTGAIPADLSVRLTARPQDGTFGFIGNPAMTLVAVIKNAPGAIDGNKFMAFGAATDGGIGYAMGETASSFRYKNGNKRFREGIGSSDFAVVSYVYQGGGTYEDAKIYINGTEATRHNSNNPTGQLTLSTTGAYTPEISIDWSGRIKSIVMMNTDDDANRQTAEGIAAHRFGLTAGFSAQHPYKSTAP